MAQTRTITVQQKGEEVHAALQYAASFHRAVEEWHDCAELKPRTKEKLIFVDENVEAKKHRTEWCAATTRYRCMRCGRNIQKMKPLGKPKVGRLGSEHFRRT